MGVLRQNTVRALAHANAEQWSENESSKTHHSSQHMQSVATRCAVAQTELSTALEAVEAAISVIEFGCLGVDLEGEIYKHEFNGAKKKLEPLSS